MLLALLAGALRLWNLGNPRALIFDETYYAKDAYALMTAGHELAWPENHDAQFIAGDPRPSDEGSYVVHPPLGKWLIAIGLRIFGTETAYGWRFSSAVAGALAVLLIALIAQRMFRSVFLGGFAGLLTAVEGHHLVMSRTALLDIFLMLFVLAAFGALLADRYSTRRRLAEWASRDREQLSAAERAWGPRLALRPWRLAAGVLLGCAVAVKLSALAFIPVFGIMVVLWDVEARRTVGVRRWLASGLVRDGLPAVATVLPLALLTYVLSWSGWLATSGGWGRNWHEENPAEGWRRWCPVLCVHCGTTTRLPQTSTQGSRQDTTTPPLPGPGSSWAAPSRCTIRGRAEGGLRAHRRDLRRRSLLLRCRRPRQPLIWWTGAVAAAVVLLLWLGRRDWRSGAVLSGFAAGYAVWLLFPDRTMFFFYTISFHPFLILAVTILAALVLRWGTRRGPPCGSATRCSCPASRC
ncbi:phospholipid carrier-dependent glycosyltransferase [Nesterenkonia pannonica]|uniref:dolichyl-phosphate-mannose--protein mannosyltransferase n=1 Tax=Nesterenkonia pannonica TaxID=1548602 RepID=UPI0021641F32|nr:phospholipid carrier-dependent glycosyltransferase [Nesterenkonia pannonica]